MNIIVIGPDYSGYQHASYQYEFLEGLKSRSDNYYHYSKTNQIDINKLLYKANFIPDFIFFNHGWLLDNPDINKITYGKINNIYNQRVKKILFLNKEYTRLKEKQIHIKKSCYDLVFTHLHYYESLNQTNTKTIFLPLACSYKNLNINSDKKLVERKYDLFFSGILQNWNFKNLQSDLRKQIQFELFYCIFDFPILKKIKYWNLRIYWKPFYKNRIKNIISDLLHGKRLSQKDYFKILSNSKSVLHTSSPIGIISTRVFESLGSGALGLFSSDSQADFIFKKNIHFISFSGVKDFIVNLYLIKNSKSNSKFQRIADEGRNFVQKNHTWKNRVAFFLDEVLKL